MLQSLSFDTWGERRAGSWSPEDLPTPGLDLLRNYALTTGFTGHEQDEAFGLINMKGRLYDPKLGRFISADPFVQAPENTQSYNRYSYVLNNPLSYTDPSGYISKKLFGFLRTVVAIASIIIAPHLTAFQMIAFQAATSAALTYAATGSLSAAVSSGFMSGVSAGLSMGLSSAIGGAIPEGPFGIVRGIAHGVAQGTVSVLQGGKFKHGFLSAFAGHVSKGLGPRLGLGQLRSERGKTARTVLAAIIGGTVSERSGGKFANGAITAAFVHLYNAEGMLFQDRHHYEFKGNIPKDIAKSLQVILDAVPTADFASMSIDFPVYWAAAFSYKVTLDRFGHYYLGVGVSTPGFGYSVGFIDRESTPENLINFLTGVEVSANKFRFGVGLGFRHSRQLGRVNE